MEFNATFIISFISFVVFILIMNQILYKPMIQIVQKRKDFIKDNYVAAQNNEEAKYSVLKERDDKITGAKVDFSTKIKQARNNAKTSKEEKIKTAKNDSLEKTKKGIEEIGNEAEGAKNELKNNVVNLAQIISDKFIETDEKISAENELIERLMN